MKRLWIGLALGLLTVSLVWINAAQASPRQQDLRPTSTPITITTPSIEITRPRPTLVELPTETPIEEPLETAAPTEEPALEPTIYGILLLVTPTPELRPKPPSLQILDLKSRMGNTAGSKVLEIPHPAPGYQVSPDPEIDEKIDLFWAWLVQREREYFEMTGRYCQMLPSHLSYIPTNGDHVYPDGWYNHPTDQQWSWDDLNAIQYEPIPFAIQIDVYSGPEGPGFVACFTMGIMQRCNSYGPNASRETPWKTLEVGT